MPRMMTVDLINSSSSWPTSSWPWEMPQSRRTRLTCRTRCWWTGRPPASQHDVCNDMSQCEASQPCPPLMPCTASVWGNIRATVIIHRLGIPSSGQMIPHSNMWGKQEPMESLMASIEVLQTVERKNPKLMPARPGETWQSLGNIDRTYSHLPWNNVSTTNHAIGPWHGIWNMTNTVINVIVALMNI